METPLARGSALSVFPDRCVNTRHRALKCQRCQESCPNQAIPSTRPLQVDATRCTSCGVCGPVCPVEAISASGPSDTELLSQLRELLADNPDLELACSRAVESGSAGAFCRQVLQTRCLARIPGVLISAAMTGARGSIWLNDTHCRDCSIGRVLSSINSAVDEAREIARVIGNRDNLLRSSESHAGSPRGRWGAFGRGRVKPTVTRSGDRTVSRRALFSFFRQSALPSGTASLSAQPKTDSRNCQIFPRRQLLVDLISNVAPVAAERSLRLPSLSLGQPLLVSSCSGCGICAKVCPTAALRFDVHEQVGMLSAEILRCVCCGACAKVCGADALAVEDSVPIARLMEDSALVLWQGELVPCSRCGSWYHPAGSTVGTCPLCTQLQTRTLRQG